ncbi:MAG TPA: trehalose-phosphatase [Steroidobacteraceae bacterium]|nr:trehalose-phosphatase [Steroidobacteraceae bacterium]
MAETGTDAPPPLLSTTAALYLDFDGTLADIALHPDEVVVSEPLPELLLALRERLAGAVAVVTGRRLAAVDAMIAPARLAGSGLHGAELRPDGDSPARTSADPAGAGPLARALRERFADDPRVYVEDKGAAVSLHFRRAPEREQDCREAMRTLAPPERFDVTEGSRVVEARPRGADKGAALAALARRPPFAGRRPVFVGDDVTDEDGFRAAERLGGYGVKVGSGPTAARYRIAEVGLVHGWLHDSLAALQRERAP